MQPQLKSQQVFIVKIGKQFLKFIWKCEESRIDHRISKKNNVGRIIALDFKTSYKTTIIKKMCKRIHKLINRKESSQIDLYLCG